MDKKTIHDLRQELCDAEFYLEKVVIWSDHASFILKKNTENLEKTIEKLKLHIEDKFAVHSVFAFRDCVVVWHDPSPITKEHSCIAHGPEKL